MLQLTQNCQQNESALAFKMWPTTNCKECETHILVEVVVDSRRLDLDRSEDWPMVLQL